jgi:hypothetical protein
MARTGRGLRGSLAVTSTVERLGSRASLLALACAFVVASCGGPSAEHGGRSSLIEQTFAGANKCNAKNHERPFIIEWDATDQSSFQARASSDIVVVKYEGCDLSILDGCSMDSLKGAFGSYKPIDWTTGQLESIDIANQNDLFAKLPLGAAALGGRVQQGEKFHMEYYVSGTRSATREHVYRSALASVPGCAGATHFVYAYNLGAFALGSASNMNREVGASYFGFGAGGTHASSAQADKKGGDLGSCKSDSAREIEGCKAPIRLTLRQITDNDDPDTVATRAPETDQAANLAGRLRAEGDRQREAAEHAKAAGEKQVAKDGTGCLAELDQHDALDPTPSHLSTNPKGGEPAHIRARCLMLAGQCDAGKRMAEKVLDAEGGATVGRLDETVGEFCQGTTASPRDQFLHAFWVLSHGEIVTRLDAAECQSAYEALVRLQGQVPDQGFMREHRPGGWKRSEAGCLARAGSCALAEKLFNETNPSHDFETQMKDLHISCGTSASSGASGAPHRPPQCDASGVVPPWGCFDIKRRLIVCGMNLGSEYFGCTDTNGRSHTAFCASKGTCQ